VLNIRDEDCKDIPIEIIVLCERYFERGYIREDKIASEYFKRLTIYLRNMNVAPDQTPFLNHNHPMFANTAQEGEGLIRVQIGRIPLGKLLESEGELECSENISSEKHKKNFMRGECAARAGGCTEGSKDGHGNKEKPAEMRWYLDASDTKGTRHSLITTSIVDSEESGRPSGDDEESAEIRWC